MAYLRLDDNFAEHPKLVALSDAAFRVHVRGLCYASRHLTDGFIPFAIAHQWGDKPVSQLTLAGVWDAAPAGFTIHDYLDWNPSAEDIRGRRDSKRMAGAMGAATRWGYSTSYGKAIAQGVGVGDRSTSNKELREKRERKRLYELAKKRLPAEVMFPDGDALSVDDAIAVYLTLEPDEAS